MPELVAMGLVGAILVFICVNMNLYFVHRSFQTNEFKTLNHNLSLVKKYWSQEQGRMLNMASVDQTELFMAKDYKKSTRSAFLFGTFMILLSWVGLLFFAIYVLSVHKLAKSRFEVRLFQSELISRKWAQGDEVLTILETLETLQ